MAYEHETEEIRALTSIDSKRYPDTNKDLVKNMRRLNAHVDYLASYMKVMQRGIDEANRNFIEQIGDFVADLLVLFAGGEPTGIQIGDLKYIIQALGALFGVSHGPFPLNLIYMASHLFFGYIVPPQQFFDLIFDSIMAWANVLGLPQPFLNGLSNFRERIENALLNIDEFFDFLFDVTTTWSSIIDLLNDGPGGTVTHLVTFVQKIMDAFSITNIAEAFANFMQENIFNRRQVAGSNFVISPDFEDTTIGRPGGSGGAYSTEQAHGGTHSWKLTKQAVGTTWTPLMPIVSPSADPLTHNEEWMKVQPDETYYFEGWARGHASNTGTTSVILYATLRNSITAAETTPTAATLNPVTTTWQKFSGYITIPAGYDLLLAGVQVNSPTPTGNVVYFDDAIVREETAVRTLRDAIGGAVDATITNIQDRLQNLSTDGSGLFDAEFLSNIANIPAIAQSKVVDLATDLQDFRDSVGGSVSSTLTDIQDRLQHLTADGLGNFDAAQLSNIANIPEIAQAKITDLVDDITPPNGASTLSAGVQAIIDKIHQARTGGDATGNDLDTVADNLMHIPQANVEVIEPSGVTTVSHDTTDAGDSDDAGDTSASSINLSWSHTRGSTANYALVTVAYLTDANSSLSGLTRTASYGSQSMLSLGFAKSTLGLEVVEFFAVFNPPSGAQTVSVSITNSFGGNHVYAAAAYCSTYIGVASISGPYKVTGNNANPSQPSVASATDRRLVQAFGVGVTGSATETLSSYSQTQRGNFASINNHQGSTDRTLALVGGDAAGAATVSFSATASALGANENYSGIAIDLKPPGSAQIGSGAKMSRTSTSNVSVSSGANLLPSSFFGAQDEDTEDITTDLTNGKFTATLSGWYEVDLCIKSNESVWSGKDGMAPVLYKNGSVYKSGGDFCYVNSGINSHGPRWIQSSFGVYLKAGDNVQAGYNSKQSITSGMNGEATGTQCYFSITLSNRGTIS